MLRALCPILIACCFLPGCKKHDQQKTKSPTRDFQAAQYYDYYQKQDSAFFYYNRVIANSHDSLEKGTAFFKMGLSLLDAGDYYTAQESLLSSVKTLDERTPAHARFISAAYNTLGNATLSLKDYDSAIRNYTLASRFAPPGDPRLYILNNLGVTYQKKGDYKESILIFDSALRQSTGDTSLKAKLISNAARTKWLADSNYFPVPDFMEALRLRSLIKDSLGMNASFSHLSDYYSRIRPDSAYYYSLKRLVVAERLDDPADKLEALGQLTKVSSPDQTKQFIDRYIKLDDSLSNVRSRNQNKYALIRFDAERSRADNILLEKHIGEQKFMIWGTVALAVLLLAGFALRAARNKRRVKAEAETAIRESRLKTSQKVHDVVANGLYKIMNDLEHRDRIEKDTLLNSIEALYETSRDISREDPTDLMEDFSQEISQLVSSFSTAGTRVVTAGNDSVFWNRLTITQKYQVRLVLEEMLINMQKHSHAKQVVIHFKEEGGTFLLDYKDDGGGFRSGAELGKGLTNTVNRIKSLNGQLNFGKSNNEGVSISISFPLEFS